MNSSEQPARGLTFGSVAEAYERYRLGYPVELVDRILGHATRPVRTALEIGAGTGKATRLFTAAGLEVTALEPDPAMLAQLESNVVGDVLPLLSAFEDADLADRFDLVYAAAALHWTDPATRWSKIAALLSPRRRRRLIRRTPPYCRRTAARGGSASTTALHCGRRHREPRRHTCRRRAAVAGDRDGRLGLVYQCRTS